MSERVIIGFLTSVILGLVLFTASRPKVGSIEWHKREYLKASERSSFPSTWRKLVGRSRLPDQERIRSLDRHHTALMKLGYLREQVFYISNRSATAVIDAVCHGYRNGAYTNEIWDFGELTDFGTNSITVTAPRDEMFIWEKLIRDADVPENGK